MPTKIPETIRDGLLVTSAVTTAGIYTASQYRLLQALAGLHQALTPEEYKRFLETPVPDRSTSGIAEITREIGGEKSKRKFNQLSPCFVPFLQSIQRFSGVINTLVSAKPEVAALIWGSVKFVITIALDYFDYFEKLSKLFEKLGDLCPLFDRFEEVFPESGRLRESLADFYAISISFYTEALRFLKKSSFGQAMKSLWKPYNISFQDLESELQRQRVIVSNEIQLASEIAARRARLEASLYQGAGNQQRLATASYQDEGRQHRQEVTLYQNETRQHNSNQMIRLAKVEDLTLQHYVPEKERKHKVLLEAISNYDHRCTFSNIRSKRHKGTGLWLFDVSEFKKWDQGQKSCGLWCHGIPGAGKSILTAGIIDHLFSRQQAASLQQDTRVSICYFFCDFATTESLKIQTILRSLIKQILSVFQKTSAEVGKDLEGVFLKGHREPDTEELNRVFLSVTQLPATTYLIIDGLDECKFDDRGQLLSSMKKLIESSKGRVKILISSRAKIDITRCLKDFYQIPLDSAKNLSDISIFVRETIDEKLNNNIFEVGDPSMVEEIKEALIRGSDGMFLWVTFQIDDICKENTDDGIRQVLQSLPKGLDETYSRILGRITTNHKPDVAKKIFIWLAIARRPLSLDELSEAVAFEPGCLRWDQGKFQNSPLNMLRNCGNLIIHDQDNRSVRFAHYTILEFLVSRVAVYSTADFLIRKQEANLYIGKVCLTYLSFPDFEIQISRVQRDTSIPVVAETWVKSMQHHNPGMKILSKVYPKRLLGNSGTSKVNTRTLQGTENTNPRPLEVLGKQFHLLDYIAKDWIYHCTELSQNDRRYWTLFENLLFRQKLPFDHLLWASLSEKPDFYFQMFWLAVEMDHLPLLEATCSVSGIENVPISTYIEKRNIKGQTALQLASTKGGFFVIQGLIDLGTNVNAGPAPKGGRTALQAAAGGGHLDVVNRLLEAKADVNAKPGKYGQTALQAAAGGGHLDVVNRLLEAKADVNAGSALQAAARGGHLDVVNRLLEAKADVNAGSALQAAAGGGHLDVVERLRNAGAKEILSS